MNLGFTWDMATATGTQGVDMNLKETPAFPNPGVMLDSPHVFLHQPHLPDL